MSDFNQSLWNDAAYAEEYRDNSNHYIVDRQTHFMILGSVMRHFVGSGRGAKVLDLGCGDGVLSAQLLAVDPTLRVTLVDGFPDMLAAAQERLRAHRDVAAIQGSFEELIADSSALESYDLAISAFAIHHTTCPEKRPSSGSSLSI